MLSTSKGKFTKYERLKSKLQIAKLFKEGCVINLYPLRIIYLIDNSQNIRNHQVLFAVSKQRIRHAVRRNKLKRILRATYRLHKYILYATRDDNMVPIGYFLIAYVYVGGSQNYDSTKVKAAVINALHCLKNITAE